MSAMNCSELFLNRSRQNVNIPLTDKRRARLREFPHVCNDHRTQSVGKKRTDLYSYMYINELLERNVISVAIPTIRSQKFPRENIIIF
jgi:hypothetical protein